MKFSKKFFLVLGLVAILASLFASTALAGGTRIVSFAQVSKVKVIAAQPATLRLLGSFTCDKVQVTYSVSGKTISVFASDLKLKGVKGSNCDTLQNFSKTITVGTLTPGQYIVLVNPDGNGKAQKKLTFIAPLLPTPTPATPAQPAQP